MSKKAKDKKAKDKTPKRISVIVSPPAPIGTPVFLNGIQCGIVESHKDGSSIIVIHDSQAAIELMHGAMGMSIGSAGSE